MDNRGFILTCAHIFQPDFKTIFVRRVDEDFHFRAELVAENIDLDLAILKPINNDGVRYNFSKFGSLIDVGMEVFLLLTQDLCVTRWPLGIWLFHAPIVSQMVLSLLCLRLLVGEFMEI